MHTRNVGASRSLSLALEAPKGVVVGPATAGAIVAPPTAGAIVALPPADVASSGHPLDVAAVVSPPKGTDWSYRMLLKKMKKSKSTLPEHAQKKIARFNASSATRRADQIVLHRKRPVIKGRGAYKRWLPSAMFRARWGRGAVRSSPARLAV